MEKSGIGSFGEGGVRVADENGVGRPLYISHQAKCINHRKVLASA